MTPAAPTSPLAPGQVVLRNATRSFSVRADHGRTLKGALIGRRSGGPTPVPALNDVSLTIAAGETVGIVGRNGAGKSSTLRVLAGIIPLQSGIAGCGGRVVSLLELGAGFSRDFSGRENIYLQGALYGFTRREIEDRVDSMIAFSELGNFIDVPVKTYSAGMFVRLGFSIAAHLDADVLLIDEVLAVGDEAFQRKCLRRISSLLAEGRTLVLVSHDLGAIERVCSRLIVLDHGVVAYDGDVVEGLLFYRRTMGTDEDRHRSLRHDTVEALLEITELELQDGAGRAATVFGAGEPLRVLLSARAGTTPLARPAVELEFATHEGVRLFRSARTLTPEELSGGVAFDIAHLPLLGGDFTVAVRVGEEDLVGEQPPRRVIAFSVAAPPDVSGPVDLRGTWAPLAALPSGA